MRVGQFVPVTGYVVTKKEDAGAAYASGFQIEENTDDFLVHAEVVVSSSSAYATGTCVVYHVLESQSFRDGADIYNLVNESDILGVYTPS